MGRNSEERPFGARVRAVPAKNRLAALGAGFAVGAMGASVVLAATGDAAAGKAVFTSAGCTGCHTLAAAGSTATVGPNLDTQKPTYDTVVARVTAGKGVMPSFSASLSAQQVANVAAFVSQSTGGSPAPPPPPGASTPAPATPGGDGSSPGTPGTTLPAAGGSEPAAARRRALVRVSFTGRRLAAAAAKVPSGAVTVVVRNAGHLPLRLAIGVGPHPRRSGRMARSTSRGGFLLPRGSVRRVTLHLDAGERGYVCRVVRRLRAACIDFQAVSADPAPIDGARERDASTGGPGTAAAPPHLEPPASATPAPASPPPTPEPPPAPLDGEGLFVANCGGCHTLADAGTAGRVGPNLDRLAPGTGDVRDQVRSGGGGMPSFRNVLTTEQIDLIARYVASVT